MKQRVAIRFLASLLIFLSTSSTSILAHGGEDHGDQKPQTAASTKGTITHVTRLGDIEVTFKHPEFIPDTPTSCKLFLTQFQTNAPVEGATAVIEFEAADGLVTLTTVEKTDVPGIFTVKLPALPQATYTVRAGITTKGETDTATFTGVEVRPAATGIAGSLYSWARGLLVGTIFLFLAVLFGTLIYLILRPSITQKIDRETVSA